MDLVKNKIDIVFANEQEIMALINTKKFDEIINFSKQLNKHIVITRGEKGAVAINHEGIFECKARENLNVIDLTGAGDLFAAGYLHGVINNMNVKKSLEKGTELSSYIIQKIGARI